MQGTIASRLLGKVQDAVRGQRNTWRHLKLPEEQPDGVNKRPEIVVAINFGAGVEANVSKYLSEFIARRRQISKQYSYYIDRLARKKSQTNTTATAHENAAIKYNNTHGTTLFSTANTVNVT